MTLFDIEPAALIYTRESGVPLHEMRCRECHKRNKTVNGGGWGPDGQYMVCNDCFTDDGEVGMRARRGGWRGRDLIVIREAES